MVTEHGSLEKPKPAVSHSSSLNGMSRTILTALKNTGKKTNAAYKYTVAKNKRFNIKPWETKKW